MDCTVSSASYSSTITHKLKKVTHSDLQQQLSQLLVPLDNQNDAVLILRKLEIDFDLDLSLSQKDIAKYWAEKIKTYLVQKIASKNTNQLIVFENYSQYLKQFLLDLIQGRAWDQWYYRDFDGLTILSQSQAIRTVLLRDIKTGLAAMKMMCKDELISVIKSLNKQDASILMDEWSMGDKSENTNLALLVTTIQSLQITIHECLLMALPSHQVIAYLALVLVKNSMDDSIKLAMKQAKTIMLLYKTMSQGSSDKTEISHWIVTKKISQLNTIVDSQSLPELITLLETSSSCELKQLTNKIIDLMALERKNLTEKISTVTRFSVFGNILLLIQSVQELRLTAYCESWPGLEETRADAVLSLLILALCQGRDRFMKAIKDPLLRDLCAVPHKLTLKELLQWINSLTDDQLNKKHKQFVEQSNIIEWVNDQQVVSVEYEKRKYCWLTLKVIEQDTQHLIKEKIDERVEKFRSDFEQLWLPPVFNQQKLVLKNQAACLLARLSQCVFKSFSHRLPGFANSSMTYLLHNFLSMSVTLVESESNTIAYLSKVPMSVMLNMTGLNRQVLILPTLSEQTIKLCESH